MWFFFLSNRKKRIAVNRQNLPWTNVNAGVLQRSILARLLSLICMNYLADDLPSNVKLLVDDSSLFLVIYNENAFARELNNGWREKD